MTRKRNIANSEPFIPKAAIRPPTKVGLRNRERSNIGARATRSTSGKEASSTSAAAKHAITTPFVQPSSLARIRA